MLDGDPVGAPVKVVVVGGGAVGLACAWELARGGADVTVLERDRCGCGCTFGNTGWICPVLATPLPAPGVMSVALRGMLKRESPIVIRPFFGPAFLRWSWRFWRACTDERYRAGTEATVDLSKRSVELFHELRDAGVEFELYDEGMIVLALTDAGVEEYVAMLGAAQEAGYDGGIEVLDGDEIRALEPAVSEAVVGGVNAPKERYVRPETLAAGLVDALRRDGAEVREESAVSALRRSGGRWRVESSTGAVDADAVVVAAGVWSGRLLAGIVDLPMEAAKGYSITARGRGTMPRHALYFAEGKAGTSSYGDALRVAGIFDLTGIDVSLRRRRIDAIADTTRSYLRDWEPTDVELEWAGLRPYPPDGLPVIGAVPAHEGLYLATGHGRKGVTLAPATAKAITELVLDGRTPESIAPFGVERFARNRRTAARAA